MFQNNNFDVIQQWQYIDSIDEKLIDDSLLLELKNYGITSLESYVTWRNIEKKQNCYDFSIYDTLVDKIKEYNLKWTPFLILGPYYSIPDWFYDTGDSVFFKCAEHNKDSKIQSIWNPNLANYVDRFLNAFAKQYDKKTLESINIGISGNWGESLYPDSGCFFGGFHTHSGYWYADQYAKKDFQEYCKEKYKNVNLLNDKWNTSFLDFNDISLPINIEYQCSKKNKLKDLLLTYYRKLPEKFRKKLKSNIYDFKIYKYFSSLPIETKNNNYIKDVNNWYIYSMNTWLNTWLKLVRKYFPNIKIYVKTGGLGSPHSGASFSEQVKIAKKYNAGIRITNQTDNYEESFVITRLTASASKYYDSYYTTEEAGVNKPDGINMRIFDSVTTYASGMYHKGLVGVGKCICTQTDLPIGVFTEGAKILKENLHYINYSKYKPEIKLGVYYPQYTFIENPSLLNLFYHISKKIRRFLDFDFFDEIMINDNLLSNIKYLILSFTENIDTPVKDKILKWVKDGNILFIPKNVKFIDFDFSNFTKYGNGYIVKSSFSCKNGIEELFNKLKNKNKTYPWNSYDFLYSTNEFFTLFEELDKYLVYNEKSKKIYEKKR